jgi:hypothetical protein
MHPSGAATVVGFQVAGHTFNSFVICFGFGLCFGVPAAVAVLIALDSQQSRAAVEQYVQRSTMPAFYFLLGLAITLALQMLCNHFIFYCRWRAGHMWLRFRFMYALYDYNLMFFNATLGLAVILTRVYVWFICGIVTIGRADLCNLPSPSQIQAFDMPWHTYVALVVQDHQYNSPVAAVFYQLLSHSLSASRRARAVRKMRVSLQLFRHALNQLKAAEAHGDANPPNGLPPSAHAGLAVRPSNAAGASNRRRDARSIIVSKVGTLVRESARARETGGGVSEATRRPAAVAKAVAPTRQRRVTIMSSFVDDEAAMKRRQMEEMLEQQMTDERHQMLLLATIAVQELRLLKERARRRALTRWALALMLLLNPSLRKLRRWPMRTASSESPGEDVEEGSARDVGEVPSPSTAASRRKRAAGRAHARASLVAAERRLEGMRADLKNHDQGGVWI